MRVLAFTVASLASVGVLALCSQKCGIIGNETPDSASEQCQMDETGVSDDTSLLQVKVATLDAQAMHESQTSEASDSSCTDLHNQGSVFTALVGVGTPRQSFHLVADTGSNALIAPSCACVQRGFCKGSDGCFNSTQSESYTPYVLVENNETSSQFGTLTYGSGSILVQTISDMVQVADRKAFLKNGVYLMEDRRELMVGGVFQGILGLGLPDAVFSKDFPLWATNAGVPKYTICFNDDPVPGALVLNVPELPNAMTNIGSVHWGLDMQGFSVGSAFEPVLFCNPSEKKAGMSTTCGGIPDSGTTFMLGPKDQIVLLYRSVCLSWPRCKAVRDSSSRDPAEIFQDLLYNCGDWMTAEKGVSEIPPIFLHLAGGDGRTQKFPLSSWSYIIETTVEEFKIVTERVFKGLNIELEFPTGKLTKTCQAAFSPMQYDTTSNGPVWIIGTPLFYEYTVGFNIGANPSEIAIIDTPCTKCKDRLGPKHAAFLDRGARLMPRFHKGPQREPSYRVGPEL